MDAPPNWEPDGSRSQAPLSTRELRTLLHDLRGPVAAILMNGEEITASENLVPMDREVIDDILGSATELLERLKNASARIKGSSS